MRRAIAATALLVAACDTSKTVLESTTTTIGPAGGTAKSADGELEIEIAASALTRAAQITVVTRRDLHLDGQLSLAYEVTPREIVLGADLQLRLHRTADKVPTGRWSLGRVDAGATIELQDFAVLPERVTGLVRGLGPAVYALFDAPWPNPCAERTCGAPCVPCDPHDPVCTAVTPPGVCDEMSTCQPVAAQTRCAIGDAVDGYDDPPGSGVIFAVDGFGFADPGRGFDVDGRCTAEGVCVDNLLAGLGDLLNDQLRQSLLGGETLTLVEIAGIDQPFTGDDASVTVKVYSARDFDDPFFPANNFRVPPGETVCCEFLIDPQSVSGTPVQARARAPAVIRNGVVSTLAPIPVQLRLWPYALPPQGDLRLERSILRFAVDTALTRLSDGVLGAALPINSLAQLPYPSCPSQTDPCAERTLLRLALFEGQPDIDLDVPGDGLETIAVDSGAITSCFDGNGAFIEPIDAARPFTCALRPAMADGFSAAFTLTGVRATVRGVAP